MKLSAEQQVVYLRRRLNSKVVLVAYYKKRLREGHQTIQTGPTGDSRIPYLENKVAELRSKNLSYSRQGIEWLRRRLAELEASNQSLLESLKQTKLVTRENAALRQHLIDAKKEAIEWQYRYEHLITELNKTEKT